MDLLFNLPLVLSLGLGPRILMFLLKLIHLIHFSLARIGIVRMLRAASKAHLLVTYDGEC